MLSRSVFTFCLWSQWFHILMGSAWGLIISLPSASRLPHIVRPADWQGGWAESYVRAGPLMDEHPHCSSHPLLRYQLNTWSCRTSTHVPGCSRTQRSCSFKGPIVCKIHFTTSSQCLWHHLVSFTYLVLLFLISYWMTIIICEIILTLYFVEKE